MNIKRMLRLAATLVALLALLAVAAFAAGVNEKEDTSLIEIPFQVNPLYEDVYDSDSLLALYQEQSKRQDPNDGNDTGNAPGLLYAPAYGTEAEAVGQIQRNMKARTTDFEVYIKTEARDSEALAEELIKEAYMHTGNPEEGDYILWQFGGWSAEIIESYRDGLWHYDYKFHFVYYTTPEQEAQMEYAVGQLLIDLDLYAKNDYEIVRTVYDYMCQNITYDYANLNDNTYTLKHTAYAAIVNKTAVCQGYATLFYRVMLEMGIDARVIAGLGNGGPHGWNIVKLDDVYYNLDTTWDAGATEYRFFLRNTENFAYHARYLEYMTTPFHMAYPMSASDYVVGVRGEPERYYVMGACGENAYWKIARDGNLVITGTGPTVDYAYYGDPSGYAPWKHWQDGFHTVLISEGITSLGQAAFYNMTNVQSIVFPNTLQKIGNYAISGCHGLTALSIPDSVTELGNNSISECKQLKEVELSEALTEIPMGMFTNCCALEEIIIPQSVTQIRSGSFDGCESLRQVTWGENLREIESNCFTRCKSLTSVVFPEGMTEIDGFYECDALTEVSIPESVEILRGFTNCDNLQTVHLRSKNAVGVFNGCKNLKNIVIYDTVEKVHGFEDCDALEELVVPESVTHLSGFGNCDNLVSADLRCETIGHASFYNCQRLETLELAEGVNTIENSFNYCNKLTHVTIPASVTKITGSVFGIKTEQIVFLGKAPEFSMYSFMGLRAKVYYPTSDPTWTEDVRQMYNGNVTWVGYEPDAHIYDDNVDGVCNVCGVNRENVETRQVVHMFRMYNPNTGEHFYTGSEEERENLIGHGWQYEGVGFTFPANTGAPVYRLFQPSTGEHLYTMDVKEKEKLEAEGWNYEGIAFNSAYNTEAVQHRLHNPNETVGAYHFTFSEEEKQNLINAGWEYQGIGWYSCWK